MKKVLLVLVLGLGLISCSKESIPEEPIQEELTCGEYGYTITGFYSYLSEGYTLYGIEVQDWDGGSFSLNINKDKWDAYKTEKELNDIACWGV